MAISRAEGRRLSAVSLRETEVPSFFLGTEKEQSKGQSRLSEKVHANPCFDGCVE